MTNSSPQLQMPGPGAGGIPTPALLGVIHRPPAEGQIYLNTHQVADRYGLSPRTIEEWRVTGFGPRFTKFGPRGAVRYALADLETWEASLPVRQSTSECDDGDR